MDCNIVRAKNRIFELSFCNEWEWFFTATLDKSKYDRTDLDKFRKDLTQFFRDFKKAHADVDIKYLMVPETHKDGESWHIHGFIYGLPERYLHKFSIGESMSKYIAGKVGNGLEVFKWQELEDKFGFNDFEHIGNHEAVSRYVTKYISKDLANSVKDVGAHLYYCSKGLNGATEIKKGTLIAVNVPSSASHYESDYAVTDWYEYSATTVNSLCDSILADDIHSVNTLILGYDYEIERKSS